MALSNRGPANSTEQSSKVLAIAAILTGKKPSNLNTCSGVAWSYVASTYIVMMVDNMHDNVIARILARMTDGASREIVLEGRVALLK